MNNDLQTKSTTDFVSTHVIARGSLVKEEAGVPGKKASDCHTLSHTTTRIWVAEVHSSLPYIDTLSELLSFESKTNQLISCQQAMT